MAEEKNIFQEKLDMKYYEDPGSPHPAEFEQVVKTRRSVRVFESEKIPEKIVESCLDMALMAPNSSNLQPWEFFWIKTSAVRNELNKAYLSQPAVTTCSDLIVAVARTKTWDLNRKRMVDALQKQTMPVPKSAMTYYTKLTPFFYTMGPLGILGFLKKILFFFMGLSKPTPREPTSPNDMKIWAIKSTALACENFMLAMRAHGYDTCPMEGVDSTRVRKILSLPRDAEHVMGIACGKRAKNGIYGPQIRFDKNLFIKKV